MDIYNYHPATGEFLAQDTATPCQLEPGQWLIPAFAATEAPPVAKAGSARVFKDGGWTYVEDHRGERLWINHHQEVEITALGAVPSELLATRPAAPPPPAPRAVSKRQFYHQLSVAGFATQQESIAVFVTGALPAALSVVVSTLPPDQQFAATIYLVGNDYIERSHPAVVALGAARGLTSEALDAFFVAAALL